MPNLRLIFTLALFVLTLPGAFLADDVADIGNASDADYSSPDAGSPGTAVLERFEGPGVLIVASCVDGYAAIDKYAYGQVFGILMFDNGTEVNVSGQYLLKAGLMEGDRIQLLGHNKYRIKSPGRPDDSIEFDQGEIPDLEIDRLAPRTIVPMDRMRDGISSLCQRYQCLECGC